jgi:hypothetical protein
MVGVSVLKCDQGQDEYVMDLRVTGSAFFCSVTVAGNGPRFRKALPPDLACCGAELWLVTYLLAKLPTIIHGAGNTLTLLRDIYEDEADQATPQRLREFPTCKRTIKEWPLNRGGLKEASSNRTQRHLTAKN